MDATSLLLLFDIDGTLVTGAAEAHAQAMHEALHTVHGVDARRLRIPIAPPRPAGHVVKCVRRTHPRTHPQSLRSTEPRPVKFGAMLQLEK